MSALLLCAASTARTERLPIKTYTIADGLAREYVNRIRQDSNGYIWFCTNEGVSRFDGYGFKNYGMAEGLPNRIVGDFIETHEGVYLFATAGGLASFDPLATNENESHFRIIPLSLDGTPVAATRLIEDEAGTVWCGTTSGVYSLRRTPDGWRSAFLDKSPASAEQISAVNTFALDKQGCLWVGTPDKGLYRRLPDGTLEHYTTKNGLSQDGISDLLLDREGRMWVGTGAGLTRLVKAPHPNENIAERVYGSRDGLRQIFVESLYQSSDGRLWVGTRGGLYLFVEPNENDGLSFRAYTTENGLLNLRILTITEDRDNNLWLGAESGGAMKMPLTGFTSYFESDQLGNGRISQLFSDREGNVYVLANNTENIDIVFARFDGQRFVTEQPALPPKTELGWGWNNLVVQDRKGDWWIPTTQGIYRFTGNKSFSELAVSKPTRLYTVQDGMDVNSVFRLFEDARGDIWFGTLNATGQNIHPLHRWDRDSDRIHSYTPQEYGIPLSAPTAFCNDSGGNLWLGFYSGYVCRYASGHFTLFTEKDGVPRDFVRDMYLDSRKRLWIATLSGVLRVDDPLAERPRFVSYTKSDGLASNQVTTITEDRWGQIYLGTGRGLDRLEPDSGKIKHYTTADGLADNFINVSLRDAKGALWFGTLRGLSRFIPEAGRPLPPPPIVISSLRAAGASQMVSEFGQLHVAIPELSYRENVLEIGFLSIGYAPGDVLRYQFKLEGSAGDWSAPSEQRTITLANLAPGSYRFLARAINSDGTVSAEPATVTFRILPPIWLRWWFIGLASIVVAAITLIFLAQRAASRRERERARDALRQAREDRLRELEQVRGRIAADLHDDIGSNLTRISLISEVAQRRLDGADPPVKEQLANIGKLSRELVDSMSEIVWAINPNKDHLGDLSQRMRHFASDLLAARQIEFRFRAFDSDRDIPVGANVRREFFLIFKEGINNIARHSGCTEADIEFHAEDGNLVLTMSDNGNGFDVGEKAIGHGLASMRERARLLAGKFEVSSGLGRGTTLRVVVPLRSEARRLPTSPG